MLLWLQKETINKIKEWENYNIGKPTCGFQLAQLVKNFMVE